MRVIHARKRIQEIDWGVKNKFNLLVWILSVLKWKELGNEVVLYADNKTLEDLKEFGIDTLYDEVNTDLLENSNLCDNIDFYYFWAMPKIISLYHETKELGNNVLVSDQDVVPTSDVSRLYNLANVLVWSNKEFYENEHLYPKLDCLSLPNNYCLPTWFSGKTKPLNTGVIHFRKKEDAVEYCNEVFKYVINNKNQKKNSKAVAMCNAEQRMIGEFLRNKRYTYATLQPANEGLFNRNAFHTHGYKNIVNNDNGVQWHCSLLKMIKDCDKKFYVKLINHDFFKEEKEYINKNGLVNSIKQLQSYEK